MKLGDIFVDVAGTFFILASEKHNLLEAKTLKKHEY